MKNIFFTPISILVLSFIAVTVQAASFSFEFNETISSTFNVGLSVGQAAKITVELDNGGTNTLSQTWTVADLQSVRFDFNNGGLVTTFNAPFDGGLAQGNGDFVTDGSGMLTAVMSNWNDFNVSADFVSNAAVGNPNWILNGSLSVYSDASGNIFLNNIATMLDPASWSEVAASSVPVPAAIWLFTAGLGCISLFRKRQVFCQKTSYTSA